MVSIRLYVEGGGNSKLLHSQCREGFRKLLESAGLRGKMPRIVAGGGREQAFDLFCTAWKDTRMTALLLVDSEEPVASTCVWAHLQAHDGWKRPHGACESHAHLMITCMESWLVADRRALRAFFGDELLESALPSLENLEAHTRESVQSALERATRSRWARPKYAKGEMSFRMLGHLDAAIVRRHAPSFDRLARVLEQL